MKASNENYGWKLKIQIYAFQYFFIRSFIYFVFNHSSRFKYLTLTEEFDNF
jgi:hypothetical protein